MKGSNSFVERLPHTRAVSSAFFSRSGHRLLSTCYDDALRMWSVEDSKADVNTPVVGAATCVCTSVLCIWDVMIGEASNGWCVCVV